MAKFEQVNPFNGKNFQTFYSITDEEMEVKIKQAIDAQYEWSKQSVKDRTALLPNLKQLLTKREQEFAQMITEEMGKPIVQSLSEIRKCTWLCDYYETNAEEFLEDNIIQTDASESYVTYDPLGVILGIMPWNYPFWQVFRFAIPCLISGNAAMLKHAPNVINSALNIENIIHEAGFPRYLFQTLVIDLTQTASLIEDNRINAVSLTGSEMAGRAVGALAGKSIKSTVMELGGSNAFIVLPDAGIAEAVETGFNARFQNTGQSCIAAKRFLIHEDIYGEFLSRFKERVGSMKYGDPQAEGSDYGPLARVDLADKLAQQVNESISSGATLTVGGKRDGAYFEPTILESVGPGMPAFDEELFGPVASFCKVKDLDEAIDLSNSSPYGLGLSIFTKDISAVKRITRKIEDGAVFVNELVKSDPRLPFGGTKLSGFGRELSQEGLLEFTNVKTIYIK